MLQAGRGLSGDVVKMLVVFHLSSICSPCVRKMIVGRDSSKMIVDYDSSFTLFMSIGRPCKPLILTTLFALRQTVGVSYLAYRRPRKLGISAYSSYLIPSTTLFSKGGGLW